MSQIPAPAPPSRWRRLFVDPSEPRLRTGWRLFLQITLLFFLIGAVSAVLFLPVSALEPLFPGLPLRGMIPNLAAFIAIPLSVWLARRYLDRRSFLSLGLWQDRFSLPDLAVGFALPGLLFLGIYAVLAALGWLRFEGWAWQTASPSRVLLGLLAGLGVFVLVGFQEELWTRGYQMVNLAESLGFRWALFLTSAVFGLLHLGNPSATWASALGIFFAALFLGYAWYRTGGGLWLPIGIHIGWNFFEGTIFGFPVSGLEGPRLILQQVEGPSLITGGAFGPEAGLIVLPFIGLGTLIVHLYTRHRTPWQPAESATPTPATAKETV